MSETRSERRKTKEQKVLELNSQGLSYRKIAKEVHVSLRDVVKYIQRISNKRESQSRTSIHDEIILEYRVNLLRSETKELESQRKNLKDEINSLHAQKFDVLTRLRARQLELDAMKRNLEFERFSKEILNDIFSKGQITT
jgi:orotate phosphoribosyltransferase-like protein